MDEINRAVGYGGDKLLGPFQSDGRGPVELLDSVRYPVHLGDLA